MRYAAIAFIIGMVLFFWRTVTARQPIVDLSAFGNRNFATGAFFSFVMGIGLYGLTYLYPVFLSRVRGYSSMMIGETMFVTGITMFFAAPIVGRLSAKVDPRILMALGFGGFALGTWQASFITKDWSFNELLIPQILRGFSLMLCMVPITNAALGTLAPNRIKNASGLFNLTRNLGGAVGLALINTVLNNRMDLHLQRLREQISWGRDVAVDTLNTMTQAFSPLGLGCLECRRGANGSHSPARGDGYGDRRRLLFADAAICRDRAAYPLDAKAETGRWRLRPLKFDVKPKEDRTIDNDRVTGN